MSRIRSVHPGLWTDEQFVSLSAFARLLVIGLWNECDDGGTFEWKPITLKMRLLPADNVDVASLLAEIEAAGIAIRYEIAGKSYGAIRNFCNFQRPQKPNDIHPKTPQIRDYCANGTTPVSDQYDTGTVIAPQMEEGGGREGEEVATNVACASGDALKPEHIVEIWNEAAPKLGKPTVRTLTPARRDLLKARIGQYQLEDFRDVFGKIERSAFLRGDSGWHGCTFDWVFKRANFQKILEGNYDH